MLGWKHLNRDFRSPSSGLPPQEVLEKQRKELQKFKANATLADVERSYGAPYREMLKEVRETLANLGTHFPSYRGQGFEIAGFVWFSGWNDMIEANPFYADLLAQFHSRRETRPQGAQSSVRYRSAGCRARQRAAGLE